jgi:protein SCO1/2
MDGPNPVIASYRLGILIVVGTILGSSLVAYALTYGLAVEAPRAGQDLGDLGYDLGSFRMVERSGKVVTEADLAGDVWVSAFIFTRCPLSCPRISSVMKGLQGQMAKAGVKLVSVSVDPDYDTPAVLTRYAQGLGADPDHWWFLTGKQDEVVDLILNRFHLAVFQTEGVEPTPDAKVEAVQHSRRLVLVDRGNKVVGVYDSDDPKEVEKLAATARRLASWARPLPLVNATLNGSCAVLLLIGWSLILTGRVRGHAACMIGAVGVSAVFLGCYLAYHFEVGSVAYRGVGSSRFVYFTVLLSHTILATLGVVPLVALTLIRAIRKDFKRHASIARVTFPIWLYVSITGVVIYWMLYQLPVLSRST